MQGDVIQTIERSLENAFFRAQDEALLEGLREAERTRTLKQAIRDASGIADEAVLDHFVALRLGPQGVAALAVVPLVLVAWADGALDAKEKAALRDAARDSGLDAQPEARALLEGWLAAPPGRDMEEAWRDYVKAVAAGLAPEARAALRDETIGRARRVAEAAGGFLGLGRKVSEAEARVLARLGQAFG
ncbi:hypothetical protein [Falsiroseomonas sp. CW058]|uniref:hypothetical protein n=1 Tax=Falsiroseomonas sp. CW058 TaxID=3388664 RepID=UPI003D31C0D0